MHEGLKAGVRTSVGSVELMAAGQLVAGPFRCDGCGHGVSVYRVLPICPMCGGTAWKPAAWTPSGRRAGRLLL